MLDLFNKKLKPLPDKMLKALLKHQWLGNVRELENVIQRYVVLGDGEWVSDDLSALIKEDPIHALKDKTSHKKVRPSLKDIHRGAMVRAESETDSHSGSSKKRCGDYQSNDGL
jgi:DNA-binding NtrC family response regulator